MSEVISHLEPAAINNGMAKVTERPTGEQLNGVSHTQTILNESSGSIPKGRKVSFEGNSYSYNLMDDEETVDVIIQTAKRYPLLQSDQMRRAFAMMRGGATIEDLKSDPEFNSYIPEKSEKFSTLLTDSKNIRDVLVYSNLRLVLKNANKFKGRLSTADLIQEGNDGLIRAIDKFDYEYPVEKPDGTKKQIEFSTYATLWIRQRMIRAIENTARTIRLPVYLEQDMANAQWLASKFERENERHPTDSELRILMERSEKFSGNAIDIILNQAAEISSPPLSLDLEFDDEDGATLQDFVAGDDNVELEVIDKVSREQTIENVNIALKKLPPRTATILDKRYMQGITLLDVGNDVNLSRSGVSKSEANALRALRSDAILREEWEDGVEGRRSVGTFNPLKYREGKPRKKEQSQPEIMSPDQEIQVNKAPKLSRRRIDVLNSLFKLNKQGTEFAFLSSSDLVGDAYSDLLRGKQGKSLMRTKANCTERYHKLRRQITGQFERHFEEDETGLSQSIESYLNSLNAIPALAGLTREQIIKRIKNLVPLKELTSEGAGESGV